ADVPAAGARARPGRRRSGFGADRLWRRRPALLRRPDRQRRCFLRADAAAGPAGPTPAASVPGARSGVLAGLLPRPSAGAPEPGGGSRSATRPHGIAAAIAVRRNGDGTGTT